MPKHILPTNWVPSGVESLELNADKAVRSDSNSVVVAGPGAGKTELLAQRACYLLQTGICPPPFRILAISFKRDAARNLKERVESRCGRQLSRRFDSLTFDAFSKSLVDRFHAALPTHYALTSDYEIALDIQNVKKIRPRLNRMSNQGNQGNQGNRNAEDALKFGLAKTFFKRFILPSRLAATPADICQYESSLTHEFWQDALFAGQKSEVDFVMLGRLAELLVRTNPLILKAIRKTYKFVFLDEFQDTTRVHYDLTFTCFNGADSVLTAVGDQKQRIMVWADALPKIFARFKREFVAHELPLVMNYRSAPRLVAIQYHLMQALDQNAPQPIANDDGKNGEGECRLFEYEDVSSEAQHLSEVISSSIQKERLSTIDFCILCRAWNDRFYGDLIEELSKRGIKARSERHLQDFLTEPLVKAVFSCLKFALSERNPEAWGSIMRFSKELNGVEEASEQERRVEHRLIEFAKSICESVRDSANNKSDVARIVRQIVDFLDQGLLQQSFAQYRQGTWLGDVVDNLGIELFNRLATGLNWLDAIEDVEGRNTIPVMTIHKSKGLEYHTMIFVGLEDDALWNFSNNPQEETCGFFVAFSRARKRVIFTFSKNRPKNRGGYNRSQTKKTIESLYDLLLNAGIAPEKIILSEK